MPVAGNLNEWRDVLRRRFDRQALEMGLPAGNAHEVFTVTAWGEIPLPGQLEQDFPALVRTPDRDQKLRSKLARWSA
jgi:hypothetical protein